MNPDRLYPTVEITWGKACAACATPPDPLDCFAWLRRLEDAARAMEKPPIRDLCADIDAPLMVGPVPFYIPSPATLDLLDQISDSHSPYLGIAKAYALHKSRDTETTKRLLGSPDSEIIREARKWSRGLSVSWESIREACNWILRRLVAKDGSEKSMGPRNWSTVVSAMMAEYPGMDEQHWMFGVSFEQVEERIEYRNERDEEERAAASKVNGKLAMPNVKSRRNRAQRRYNELAKEFHAWCVEKYGAKAEG